MAQPQVNYERLQRMFKNIAASVSSRSFGALSRPFDIKAINHTSRALPDLKSIDGRLEFHIVTEEDAVSGLQHLKGLAQVHGVPSKFAPRKAKYKARALEWFRQKQTLTAQDWILHVDEETMLDHFALRACLETVETDGKASIAQGVILYNARHYWKNILTTYADCVRTLDDFGRYQFQFNHVHRPVFGMHGAYLLINGEVENAVTWETDNLTEDYWFALQADRLGFRFGWIPAIAREQSPTNLWDFWQQRRRWATGILTVHTRLAVAFVALWAWQSLEVVL
ncbi:hypothetical protein A1O3_00532 [Capronia epimyces CBS 606.96]|uniref:Glycosyltransferase 2-like domain-containing protein n=1 Tax=Capronia epimyces CBS 606.96 TaxID=1182542 RepID=W9YGG6_9EURO|nr:uncharacterized protein A1O3_00532 [Capronia epimyces CBS 606.96]EXJ91982.1 hypothetical protein A1O3_00532 [Capronia epimyces CBS 606.96]